MPMINIEDAYILDETGAEVDKVTGLFTKNENATMGEKQMARLNIAAGGSNDNLLDNAYFVGGGSQLGDGIFPINQRGQRSYSETHGNIFDRWTLQGAFATLAADAVYFGSTTQDVWGLMQQVPSCFRFLWGKTVTVSAILDNDVLVQGTYTLPSSGAFDMPAAGLGGVFINLYSFDGSNIVFRIYTKYTASYHIKAVKLELGTVSTLANDAPPDFGEELRKCQRYLFIRDYAKNDIIANGLTNNLTMFLPASMRSGGSPIMTFTVTPHVIGNGVISTPTSVNLASVNGNQVQIYAPTTESHNAQTIVLYAGSATRMTIANEL